MQAKIFWCRNHSARLGFSMSTPRVTLKVEVEQRCWHQLHFITVNCSALTSFARGGSLSSRRHLYRLMRRLKHHTHMSGEALAQTRFEQLGERLVQELEPLHMPVNLQRVVVHGLE
jgi:hypothetical protein